MFYHFNTASPIQVHYRINVALNLLGTYHKLFHTVIGP